MCKLLHRGPTDTRSPTDTVLVRLVFSSLNFFDDFFEGGTKGVREKEGERERVYVREHYESLVSACWGHRQYCGFGGVFGPRRGWERWVGQD